MSGEVDITFVVVCPNHLLSSISLEKFKARSIFTTTRTNRQFDFKLKTDGTKSKSSILIISFRHLFRCFLLFLSRQQFAPPSERMVISNSFSEKIVQFFVQNEYPSDQFPMNTAHPTDS